MRGVTKLPRNKRLWRVLDLIVGSGIFPSRTFFTPATTFQSPRITRAVALSVSLRCNEMACVTAADALLYVVDQELQQRDNAAFGKAALSARFPPPKCDCYTRMDLCIG